MSLRTIQHSTALLKLLQFYWQIFIHFYFIRCFYFYHLAHGTHTCLRVNVFVGIHLKPNRRWCFAWRMLKFRFTYIHSLICLCVLLPAMCLFIFTPAQVWVLPYFNDRNRMYTGNGSRKASPHTGHCPTRTVVVIWPVIWQPQLNTFCQRAKQSFYHFIYKI